MTLVAEVTPTKVSRVTTPEALLEVRTILAPELLATKTLLPTPVMLIVSPDVQPAISTKVLLAPAVTVKG
jgi:hypothetical protein